MGIMAIKKKNKSELKVGLKSSLSKELVGFKKGDIYIILTKPESYHTVCQILLKHLVETLKYNGLYITLNTPCNTIASQCRDLGLNASKLHFVDGISKKGGIKEVKANNCSYIESPSALTELSITLTTATNTGKFDFLFLDSISTLLIYNDIELTERFIHHIVSKLRNLEMCGVLIAIDEEKSRKLVDIVSQFCDKLIVA